MRTTKTALGLALLAATGVAFAQAGAGFRSGDATTAGSVSVRNSTCTTRAGYGIATGWLLNTTSADRTVYLTTTFLAGRNVVDSVRLRYHVPAGRKTAFDVTGGRGKITGCDWRVEW